MSQLPPSRQLRIDQVIAAWFVALTLLLEGAVLPISAERQALLPSLPIADLPVLVDGQLATATPSGITAPRFIALDVDSASVLTQFNGKELQPPASVLKLLTALVVLDFYKPEDVVTLTAEDVTSEPTFDTYNDMKLQVGELISIQDLLASLIIKSDNRSAEILAAHVPGGREAFLAAMQVKANQFNLNPAFKAGSPSGLDQPGQQLTPKDLVLLGEQAQTSPLIAQLMAEKNHLLTGKLSALTLTHPVMSTNQFLWEELPIVGGKTGTTEQAGEVLLSIFKIQNHTVMIVVMSSADRYADTRAIFNWIQTHYHWQSWDEFAYNE